MNINLNWFERLFKELKNEQAYVGTDSYYEFIEYLNDSLIFEKNIGNKHPVIELYDFDHEERVNYICFDPANQQFYLPVYNDEIGKKCISYLIHLRKFKNSLLEVGFSIHACLKKDSKMSLSTLTYFRIYKI